MLHEGRLGGVPTLSLVGRDDPTCVTHVVPQQPPERQTPVLAELELALGQHLLGICGFASHLAHPSPRLLAHPVRRLQLPRRRWPLLAEERLN